VKTSNVTDAYRRAIGIPWLVSIIGMVFYSSITNRNYKSEWITVEGAIQMDILAAVVYGFIMCLLALGIFLNVNGGVRKSFLFSALSWFLIPVGFAIIFLYGSSRDTVNQPPQIIAYFLALNLPFLIGLIASFISFRKGLASANRQND
jgi:hypothetical protein